MAAQIGADFEQMLENIHTLVKGIEAAGVGSRGTEIDGLRTNTTATYLDSASGFAAEIERMIGQLAADVAAFRDALKSTVEEKQQSEENLSATLSQIAQVVDDPSLTSTTQLEAGTSTSAAPVVDPSGDGSSTDDGGSKSGGY
ncbi:hypothetical protein [Microbacterium sp. LWH13-1.2]|uniref:hypothetical protein n=1 Tax=Microbacterium sp. LWH13-1.2 TaxID=3135260 RepID=UPI003138B2BC